MTGKTDLRVVKTKKALISSMLAMLREMPFGKITVNEICARALVSRSAFYAHFLDKYDLLTHCLETVSKQLFNTTKQYGMRDRLRFLLENIQKDSRLFENLLMADYDTELMELLRKGFLQNFYEEQERINAVICFPHPQEVSATFCAAGFTGTIIFWIRGNMKYSVDQMTECLWLLMPKEGGA